MPDLFDFLSTPTFSGSPLPGGGSSSSGFDWKKLLAALLPVGGSIATAVLGNKAASGQSDAAMAGVNLARDIYNKNLGISQPWIDAGSSAVKQLAFMLGLSPNGGTATPGNSSILSGGSTNSFVPHDNTIYFDRNNFDPADHQDAVALRHSIGMARNTPSELAGPVQEMPRFSWMGRGATMTGDAHRGMDPSNPGEGFGSLMHDFGAADFFKDPGYNFRLSEGMKALEHSAAARGTTFSGGTQKALARYNQGFATNEYTNAYNRYQSDRASKYNYLAGLSGLGQTSANTVTNAGENFATNATAGLTGAANARASGYGTTASSVNSGIAAILDQLIKAGKV